MQPGYPPSYPHQSRRPADDGASGRELWRSDGTPEGTALVRDVLPGPGSASPSCLVEADGSLLFVADDGRHGDELWRSDGTEAGTELARDINQATSTR